MCLASKNDHIFNLFSIDFIALICIASMVSRDNKRIPFDYDTGGSITLPNSILHMPWFICDRSRDLDIDWLVAFRVFGDLLQ